MAVRVSGAPGKRLTEQEEHLINTYGPRGQNIFGDFMHTWDSVGNALLGAGRAIGDWSGGIADYTGLDKNAGLTALLRGFNPRDIYGTGDPMDAYPVYSNARSNQSRRPDLRGVREADEKRQQRQTGPMSFQDYWALAESLGLGGSVDYTPLMDAARRNHSDGDARLAALYSRLQGDIANARPGIDQTFDTAVGSVGQAGDDTRALIQAAYEGASADRAAQLAALGIEDAAIRDDYSAGDNAAAIARTAERQNIGENQLESNRGTALNYNTEMGLSAGQQGAEMRSALERALYDRLAELEVAQSEANANLNNNLFSTVMNMYSNAPLFDPYVQQQMSAQQGFENEMAANKFALEQYKAMGSGRTLADLLNLREGIVQTYPGIDPESLEALIDQLSTLGKIVP